MSSAPVAILLAAGSSQRFGGHKLSHLIDGVPMALKSAVTLKSALGAVLVGMRPQDALAPTLLGQGHNVILCDRAFEGMGGTLAQVVAAAPADASGYIEYHQQASKERWSADDTICLSPSARG